jgi:hypothetical protein
MPRGSSYLFYMGVDGPVYLSSGAMLAALSKIEHLDLGRLKLLAEKVSGRHAPASICCNTAPIWLSNKSIARLIVYEASG